jgi:hypothetical protein
MHRYTFVGSLLELFVVGRLLDNVQDAVGQLQHMERITLVA